MIIVAKLKSSTSSAPILLYLRRRRNFIKVTREMGMLRRRILNYIELKRFKLVKSSIKFYERLLNERKIIGFIYIKYIVYMYIYVNQKHCSPFKRILRT